ncbi:MAG: hypothetical protein AB7D41_03560 [Arcobacter sp.]|uniref:hypothetical protein n=1 Tax=Arcobacter sp. TaxID=1872629 RepID=UPI003CFE87D1
MEEQKYEIVEVVEDVAKIGYSISVFASKFFYQVSSVEALKNSMDAYMVSRFSQRLEYFIYEHEKLTNKEKKDFYEDLKNNKQNLNYLYEFIEKARTTTYELHAKILARLSADLIKNKSLDFGQSSLLAGLNTLTYDDFKIIKDVLKRLIGSILDPSTIFGNTYTYETPFHWEFISIDKFFNIGIISRPYSPPKNIYLNDLNDNYNFRKRIFIVCDMYTINFFNMLNDLINE